MPRKSRETSATGIYHVMLRGINRQDIFEDAEDYSAFIRMMSASGNHGDGDHGDRSMICRFAGSITRPVPAISSRPAPAISCYIYAYCLMPNHVHLLLREKTCKVGEIVKSIASSYVLYYNKKYGRIGHLLQDRFKSEPCNDSGYFLTLFRYIHQNPVKAGLVKAAKDNEYSSWRNDYLGLSAKRICYTESAVKRYGMEELTAWVDMPLPEEVGCLDMDERRVVSDEAVRGLILKKCGARSIAEFQLHTKQRKKDIVRAVIQELGVGPRQMVRVSGMTYAVIHKIWIER